MQQIGPLQGIDYCHWSLRVSICRAWVCGHRCSTNSALVFRLLWSRVSLFQLDKSGLFQLKLLDVQCKCMYQVRPRLTLWSSLLDFSAVSLTALSLSATFSFPADGHMDSGSCGLQHPRWGILEGMRGLFPPAAVNVIPVYVSSLCLIWARYWISHCPRIT